MEELKNKLIRKRASAKSVLTSIDKSIIDFQLLTAEHYEVLLFKQTKLNEALTKFENAQDELEEIEPSEFTEREEFYDRFEKISSKLNVLIKSNAHLQACSPNLGSNLEVNANFKSGIQSQFNVKLPDISIPSFSGDFCNWLQFRDTFKAIVIDRPELSNIAKFYYLNSSLSGEPKKLLENLQPSDSNFLVAWELLENRYNNVRLIANNHIRNLFNPPTPQKGCATSLRSLIDHFSSNVNALRALDLNDVPIQDLILSQMILNVLEPVAIRDWETLTSSSEIPSLSQMFDFLEKRCKILEALQCNSPNTNQTHKVNPRQNQTSPYSGTSNNACIKCKGSHLLYACEQFRKLSHDDRWNFVKRNNLCYNCLRPTGRNHSCSSKKCLHCQNAHHTLLHFFNPNSVSPSNTFQPRAPPPQTGPIDNRKSNVAHFLEQPNLSTVLNSNASSNSKQLLPTAQILVKDVSGRFVTCTALLDSGSDCNLVSINLIDRLRIPTYSSQTVIDGVSGQSSTSGRAALMELHSCHTSWKMSISAIVVDKVSADLPADPIEFSKWGIPPNLTFADPNCSVPKPIDLLLGADIFFQVLCEGKFSSSARAPTIQNTLLGWIFGGRLPVQYTHSGPLHVNSALLVSREQVHSQLERFWKIEEIHDRTLSPDDLQCEDHFVLNTTRNCDGRYVVRLPRKVNFDQLGQSKGVAFKRFQALERRLSRDPELRHMYLEFMDNYLSLGHMELVPPSLESSSECYHIPHHPVLKPSSSTTKLRVVFDASTPSTTGLSLNDTLLVGPVLQQDLFSITVRFRTHSVVFASDICQMFRQVLIHPDDRDLQRILWRTSPSEPLLEYHLNTVTYGTAPASFLATRALKQLAIDHSEAFPRASVIVQSDFYVDDCISGCETHEQAVDIYHELNGLLALGGFQLRKWSTNSKLLLDTIPESDREAQTLRGLGNDQEAVVKTLGLFWQSEEDNFYIQGPLLPDSAELNFTKRTLLATIASIFDPLGLIAPVVIACKMLFQGLWTAGLEWDDKLPPHILESWSTIVQGLPLIARIAIPRFASCVTPVEIQLHGFCDSSEKAYGACLYLLSCNASGQSTTHLLCAKSRVAPVKKLSIPRLELCAAVLLARLLVKVKSSLSLNISSTTLWSDSTIVLAWIKAPPQRWKTFVANRVAEIQSLSVGCSWLHVASRDNPADLISRGSSPSELRLNSLWWRGPSWLSNKSGCESIDVSLPSVDNSPERKVCNFSVYKSTFDTDLLHRYSFYPLTVRIVALCKRFIHNGRSASKSVGPLSVDEINGALISVVKVVQSQHFHSELVALSNGQPLSSKSSLLDLHPFLHVDGTLRVGGRLQNSELPFDSKHQMILPADHFARKLIRYTHFRLLHGGINLIIADVRQRFWIPNIRRLVRSVVRACSTCFRFSARPAQQIMGQLPAVRVQPAHPFLNVGVDYAGPFAIRYGGPKSKISSKAYLAIFVCMSTKAVHTEVVTSLTTAAFIAAFSRFYSRRGIPSHVYSDNGSNFVGAQRELSELSSLLASHDFQHYVCARASNLMIQWHFIPPRAPHFGGLWEASVKSLKFHLRRATSGQLFTYEEFSTLTIQIEAVLNSRPIAPLSDDSSEFSYLSPGHFLIGRALTTLPTPDLIDVPVNHLSRWQRLQKIILVLWNKWSAQYLQTLQRRSKWRSQRPDIQIGELVLLMDEASTPLKWKMALVVATHPGPDGMVRVLTLKTPHGFVKRAINRVCVLPCEDDTVDVSSKDPNL